MAAAGPFRASPARRAAHGRSRARRRAERVREYEPTCAGTRSARWSIRRDAEPVRRRRPGDNEIVRLEGFPALPRPQRRRQQPHRARRPGPRALLALETLTLTNNRVTSSATSTRRRPTTAAPLAARQPGRRGDYGCTSRTFCRASRCWTSARSSRRSGTPRKVRGARRREGASARARPRAGRRRRRTPRDGDGRGRARRPHPEQLLALAAIVTRTPEGDAARAGAHHRSCFKGHAFVMC